MKFTLEITLGNAAMQSGDDIAAALIDTADRLAAEFDGLHMPDDVEGTIRDANGNTVGGWAVEP